MDAGHKSILEVKTAGRGKGSYVLEHTVFLHTKALRDARERPWAARPWFYPTASSECLGPHRTLGACGQESLFLFCLLLSHLNKEPWRQWPRPQLTRQILSSRSCNFACRCWSLTHNKPHWRDSTEDSFVTAINKTL